MRTSMLTAALVLIRIRNNPNVQRYKLILVYTAMECFTVNKKDEVPFYVPNGSSPRQGVQLKKKKKKSRTPKNTESMILFM